MSFAAYTSCTKVLLCDILQYEYLWADGVKVKKPVRLSAPDYINALFDWVEAQVCLVKTNLQMQQNSTACHF